MYKIFDLVLNIIMAVIPCSDCKKGKKIEKSNLIFLKLNRILMRHKYQINLISDSTGETLDRIFLALRSQFSNFDCEKKEYVFVRTEQQINEIIKKNE